MVSVIIPSRNEMFLSKTVDDIFAKARGEIEVVITLDGYWPDPPLKDRKNLILIYRGEAQGMRSAVNSAASVARGEYLMKTDAHCLFDEGFDVKLSKDCEYTWTSVPVRYRLFPNHWRRYKTAQEFQYIRKIDLSGKDWPEYAERVVGQVIVDLMTMQGSCWFMHRKRFFELGGLDAINYGTMGREAQEICLKTWLSGGRLVLNRSTWYGRWQKDKNLYENMKFEKLKSERFLKDFWLNNKWPMRVHDFDWLIQKFSPVPTWE